MEGEGEDQSRCNTVSIKPPIFSESSVEGWFLIMESQFAITRIIQEETKFHHVLSALPSNLVSRLPKEIITQRNYTALKEKVIEVYEATKPELFDKLIQKTKMCGRPSIFLHELQSIASKVGVGDDLVRHRFVNALPSNISPVLASRKDMPLAELGTLADELLPLVSQSPVQPINVIEAKNYGHQTNKSNLPYGLRPYKDGQKPQVCKAHLYYGPSAKTCKSWCKWPKKVNCRILPNSRNSSPSREETSHPKQRSSEN